MMSDSRRRYHGSDRNDVESETTIRNLCHPWWDFLPPWAGLTVAPTGFLGIPTNPQLVIRQQLIQIPRELIHRRTKPFLHFQLPDKAPSSPAQGPRSWLGGSLEVVNAWKLKPKQPQSPLQGLQSGSEKCYLAVLAAGRASRPCEALFMRMSCQQQRHCGRVGGKVRLARRRGRELVAGSE